MSHLERALFELGAELAYPATPPIHRALRSRIAGRSRPLSRWQRPLLRRAFLLAAAALLLLGLLAAFPGTRASLAHWFHVRGLTVSRAAAPFQSATPAALYLGIRMDLAQAEGRTGFRVVEPARLGAADAIYYDDRPLGGAISLGYNPRPGLPAARLGIGLLMTEFRGRLDAAIMGKIVGEAAPVEEVLVNGQPGFWIAGAPHEFFYLAPDGSMEPSTLRLAANTLIWQQGGIVLRIESMLSRADTLTIAQSIH